MIGETMSENDVFEYDPAKPAPAPEPPAASAYPWLELTPLDMPGAMAATINRRIATHLKFRADIDAGVPVRNRLRPKSDPVAEALRREKFIRLDTVTLLRFKNLDTAAAEAAVAAVDAALREAL